MIRPRMLVLLIAVVVVALSPACGPSGESRTRGSAGSAQSVAPSPPAVDVTKVISRMLDVTLQLPGEIQPYQVVAVYPKVTGFVQWIGVDRGSRVKAGELIIRLEAPELVSQRAEAQAKVQSAEAQLIEAEARLAADENTYQRMKAASTTPGVVSGNDLDVTQKTAEADRARVNALQDSAAAAKAALQAIEQVESYLQVKAPFDGIVTERNVHPGALVGPAGGPGVTVLMVRIETLSRLRLVVPVPESFVADIPLGAKVMFTVPAYPNQLFSGIVSRVAHSVDVKTRTMPVELDVWNPSGRLNPGMFPEVSWPARRLRPTLFVPAPALARTTERVFVVRVREGKAEWVDVKTGTTSGDLIEVFGDLREGDEVAVRGTDELRPGTHVAPRLVSTR